MSAVVDLFGGRRVESDPDSGQMAVWMTSPALRRRLERGTEMNQEAKQPDSRGERSYLRPTSGQRPLPVEPMLTEAQWERANANRLDPAELRDLAVRFRRSGMPCDSVLQHVSDAMATEGQRVRRQRAEQAMQARLEQHLGLLLPKKKVAVLARHMAETARQLANEGVFGVSGEQ